MGTHLSRKPSKVNKRNFFPFLKVKLIHKANQAICKRYRKSKIVIYNLN